MYKTCRKCGDTKKLEEFRKWNSADGRSPRCSSCMREYEAARREARFETDLWHKYRITPDQYYEMLVNQNGVCALCETQSDERLCVDHDHACCPNERSCGQCVRGLLCKRCNTGLGMFGDNSKALLAAVDYLERANRV